MAMPREPNLKSETEEQLVEIRDVTVIATFFGCPGGVRPSDRRKGRNRNEIFSHDPEPETSR